jgi:HSP20 family molecular chaperone IbpA
MFDNLNSFRRTIDEAASDHMVPRADVVEDKNAYRFYIEMPALKDDSIDVHVEDDRLIVASERPSRRTTDYSQDIACLTDGPANFAFGWDSPDS